MDSVWNTVIGQLPSEVLSYLGGHSLNVVAWGCGEEIGPLKSRFPHCRTMTADSENQSDLPRSVEVLFSINYLPQFSEPLEELKNLLNLRSSVAIFVVPQSEFPLRENHRSQFRQENFPELLAGFSRSTLKTIQLETERGLESHLLVIYSSETFRKLYGTTDVAQAEMDKWNQYYSGLESVTETPSLQAFHGEFTEAMVDLLPPSSRILEAGCGAAFQSLALARLGRFDISVMDISNEALTSARQRFDQAHLPVDAFLGDTFAPGKPEFDLVFNAGVLEHYTLNEQVDFIRGMASRSRNFVLILVPNRLCYWYWMWRIHISKKEAWPFGKECPMVDMSTAFEKAGLRFVGQTFFGEAWTEDLIHHLPGLSQEIREDILGIHRSPFLDKSHKCYLLAALGTVAEQTAEIPDIWSSTGLREDFRTAEITGALADTLAGKLSLESRMRSTQQVYEAALAENRYYRSLVYSKVWRIAERVQKIRNIVAPEGSWRSLTLRKMKNGIKKIGSVTIQGIRNIIPAPKGLDEIQQKAANGQQVVVFLPSIRWQATLFQRPQHLARQFAKMGYVTIYDCTETDEKLYGFKELEPNLYLYKGPTRHLASLPNPWLWAFTYNFHLKDKYQPGTTTIYDWIDDLAVFPFDQAFLQRNHDWAVREATVVTSVARRLHKEAQMARPDAIYLPNAVEYDRFADPSIRPAVEPELHGFLADSKPICGYYGALASWFDYGLLKCVAELRRDWNFILIGPDHDGSLGQHPLHEYPNIAWLGIRDYQDLPRYLKRFDVTMIPFVINDITLATSPLKLFEYFAGGKPVITSPMPECMAFEEIHIVRNPQEFAGALTKAYQESRSEEFRQQLRRLGKANSWEARVQQVIDRLEPRPSVAKAA